MPIDHRGYLEALRKSTLDGQAATPASIRKTAADRAAGGTPMEAPYDALALGVGAASSRVTDAEVEAVRAAAGSERATFEIIAAACLGAALERWRWGTAALEEADHAAS